MISKFELQVLSNNEKEKNNAVSLTITFYQ